MRFIHWNLRELGLICSAVAIGFLLGSILLLAGPGVNCAFAQGQQQYPPNWKPIIYPSKGQTQQQQDMDNYQCYSWAKQDTGFDPMAPIQPTAPPPPAQGAQGGAFRGGAVGALGGLAIGSLFGEAGKGAAIGAIGGGLFGGMRRREQMESMAVQQDQYVMQQQAIYSQNRNNYNRAFTACMEGRGYTVQ